MLGCCLWIICLYCFYCLVNDDLYLLTTWLPVHGLFFMVDCVWLCCLNYAIVWMSRVKASFKCWSILITNLGKQSSFSPSVSLFFSQCVCAVALVISLFVILVWLTNMVSRMTGCRKRTIIFPPPLLLTWEKGRQWKFQFCAYAAVYFLSFPHYPHIYIRLSNLILVNILLPITTFIVL